MFNKIFDTLQNGNDVRGAAIASANEKLSLTPDIAGFIAAGFILFLSEKLGKTPSQLRIGIGRDSRLTGNDLLSGTSVGLGEATVYDCGMISTPAMFQSTVLKESDFDASVMITASHLPFNRNGMKFFTKDGGLEHDELTAVLQKAADIANQFGTATEDGLVRAAAPYTHIGKRESFDLLSLYADNLCRIIKEKVKSADKEHPLKGLHIVVDAGNGAAGFFADRILQKLGADTSGSVFLEPDGTFPNHIPNPENAAAMDAVKSAVLQSKADLGVIFDCDGDRGAVVFSDGTEVNRNTLIALLAAIAKDDAPHSVIVTDSVTSDELTEFLENSLEMKHLRFKRGYKNVIDKAIALNQSGIDCPLAIETSGHGAFRENYFSDDGAYLSVMIICRLAMMRAQGKELSSLIADLKQPAEALEKRYSIKDTPDFKAYSRNVLNSFQIFAEKEPMFHIVTPNYEGIRVSFDDDGAKGWMLVRASLHDPVIPVNIESCVKGGSKRILERVQPFFDSFGLREQ